MPEGDTIHRTAAALREALVGDLLVRTEVARAVGPTPSPGARVTAVEARGKHLLVHLDTGLVVHTHLRMTGSWRLIAPGQRWPKPAQRARVVLATARITAVCFSAPVVEVLDRDAVRRHPALRRLGPDLLEPTADLDEVLVRTARLVPTDRAIGEVLLDQRVAGGIGNVYRCDVLFLAGLDPRTPLGEVPTEQRRWLFATAGSLLRDNLDRAARTTVPGAPPGSLWVHGRGGRPCRRCGTSIEVEHLGEQARVVYRCPTCQPRAGRHLPDVADATGSGDRYPPRHPTQDPPHPDLLDP